MTSIVKRTVIQVPGCSPVTVIFGSAFCTCHASNDTMNWDALVQEALLDIHLDCEADIPIQTLARLKAGRLIEYRHDELALTARGEVVVHDALRALAAIA